MEFGYGRRQGRRLAGCQRLQRLQVRQALAPAAEHAQRAPALGHRLDLQRRRHLAHLLQQAALLVQRLQRQLVVAQADAQAADHPLQLGQRQRLVSQFGFAPLLAGGQQLRHVEMAVALAGRLVEQADGEILHGLRTRHFHPRLARLPQGDGRGQQQRQHRQRRQGHAPAMAANVLAYPVPHARRSRLDRLSLQVAAQVAGQRFGRAVALLRVLLQGLFQQYVQIAP
ncbi:hypothetical protein D3C73_1077960 [compost metagenome]